MEEPSSSDVGRLSYIAIEYRHRRVGPWAFVAAIQPARRERPAQDAGWKPRAPLIAPFLTIGADPSFPFEELWKLCLTLFSLPFKAYRQPLRRRRPESRADGCQDSQKNQNGVRGLRPPSDDAPPGVLSAAITAE